MGDSIGTVSEVPLLASAARLRAILPGVVTSSTASSLNDRFASWAAALLDDERRATRLTIRCVAEHEAVASLRHLEAVISLGGGYDLVYLGENAPDRRLGSSESRRLDEIALAAANDHGRDGGPNLEKVRARLQAARTAGYVVEVATSASERGRLSAHHSKQVGALLSRFGYGREEAEAVIGDESNLVATASHGGRVVGVVVLERCTVPLGSTRAPLALAELTDSSVEDDHVGHGLQLVLHAHLVAALVRAQRAPEVIFSESGYTASLFNAARLGRTFAGRLPHHARIDDVSSLSSPPPPYQSLEVTYLDRARAEALVRALDDVLGPS